MSRSDNRGLLWGLLVGLGTLALLPIQLQALTHDNTAPYPCDLNDHPCAKAKSVFVLDDLIPGRSGVELGNLWTTCRSDSSHDHDVLHYDFNFTLDVPSRTIFNEIGITSESTVAALDSVDFHFIGHTVDSVLVDGATAGYRRAGEMIYIDLLNPRDPGEQFVVTIGYHGTPSDGFHFDPPHKTHYNYSWPDEARYWFPCYDEPWDKATLDVRATAKLGWKIASNGRLVEIQEDFVDSTVTYVWHEGHPIVTYNVALSFSKDYAFWSEPYDDTTDVHYYVWSADSADAVVDYENTVAMIQCFSDLIYPYPFSKYGMAVAPIGGAMEHQTITSYGGGFITGDKRYEDLVSHELMHSWFGNMVSIHDWREIWMSEGFATFGEFLFRECHYGRESMLEHLRDSAWLYFQEDAVIQYPLYDPAITLGVAVYEKGGWVLHMLRHVVGDSTFFDVLGQECEIYGHGNIKTVEFIALCESVSGQDLQWFFDEWVYDVHYPEYRLGWTSELIAGDDYDLRMCVIQAQSDGPVFTMPVDFTVETSLGDTTFTVWVDAREEIINVMVTGEPTNVILDPDEWILKKVDDATDAPPTSDELQYDFLTLRSCVPNPCRSLTQVAFALPAEGEIGLAVYDVTGRKVRDLLGGPFPAGNHQIHWDVKDEEGSKVAPGVYFVRLEAVDGSGKRALTGKLVVVR